MAEFYYAISKLLLTCRLGILLTWWCFRSEEPRIEHLSPIHIPRCPSGYPPCFLTASFLSSICSSCPRSAAQAYSYLHACPTDRAHRLTERSHGPALSDTLLYAMPPLTSLRFLMFLLICRGLRNNRTARGPSGLHGHTVPSLNKCGNVQILFFCSALAFSVIVWVVYRSIKGGPFMVETCRRICVTALPSDLRNHVNITPPSLVGLW